MKKMVLILKRLMDNNQINFMYGLQIMKYKMVNHFHKIIIHILFVLNF